MDNTTALDGDNIDAVAASLINMPPKEDEADEAATERAQADEATAQDGEESDAGQADEAETDGDPDDAEDETDADDGAEEPAEQLYTVKVNGRDLQVPLNELLRGYSGQAYIQQGMENVAKARQEVEQVYTALQTERQQLAQFVQAAQAGQLPLQPPQPPDDSLLQSDPIGYLEARVKYDKDVAAHQQAVTAMQELQTRNAQAEERARMAYLADQHRQLAQVIPAFAKPETAEKVKQELITTGMETYGYSAEELRGITDHRALRVLHDAAQFRRLMAGKQADKAPTPQKAQQTPTLKPGVKQSPTQGKAKRAEQARSQMKRTGSVDDVAQFLLM